MKKWIVILIGLMFLASATLFVGSKEDKKGAAPEGKSKFAGQTIVVKLSPDIAMSGLKGKTEEFEKEYGVTVDYSEIAWDVWFGQQAQILATDEPLDVMGNGKNAWIEFPNKLTPLTNIFADMFDQMVPELVDYSTLRGEVMAVPFLPSYQIMFYNKKLFKEAEESRAAAEQANKAKSTFLGV